MDVVAVTLAGGNREGVIGDATRSVLGIADRFLLLRTDDSADAAIEVVKQIVGEDRCIVRPCPIPYDCGLSRTVGLLEAELTGADWAMILDTDERFLPNGEDVRGFLGTTEAATVMALRQETGADGKERFIRLPFKGYYWGRAHEYYTDLSNRVTLKRAQFYEVAKSNETLMDSIRMVAKLMPEQIAEEPDCGRWHYYLGDALIRLGDPDGGLEQFTKCQQMVGDPEELRAFACLRAALILGSQGKHRECLERCAYGMTIHSGIAELPWLASQACLNMGLPQQASWWSMLSITGGAFCGFGKSVPTRTHSMAHALYEAPFFTLMQALAESGNQASAQEAARRMEEARRARLALTN